MAVTEQGNCFENALRLVGAILEDADAGVDEVVIAHGTPIGTGPHNGGRRYWHAWVELRQRGGPWVVIDAAKGPKQVFQLRRAAYYRAGRIDGDEHVWRFTPDEAQAEMNARGHVGPWVDDYKEVAL